MNRIIATTLAHLPALLLAPLGVIAQDDEPRI